jgi:hypothetical protein
MADGFPDVQVEPALEQDQDQRERAKRVRDVLELVRPGPPENWANQNSCGHENDDVRNTRPAKEPVGPKSQDQQSAEQSEQGGQIHLQIHYTMLRNQKPNSVCVCIFRYNLKSALGRQVGQGE